MADIDVTIGADTTAFQTGMAAIRNEAQKTSNNIASGLHSSLLGWLSVGAVVGEFEKVINKAEEIHKQSARFGIDAEQFQKLSNAAKEVGISSEAVARTMNLMAINGEKALNPTTKQALALENLNISAQDFAAASPWDKMLMLSSAYTTAADQGRAYSDVSEIIGRKNTEMLALISQGPDKIKEYAAAFPILSQAQIDALHEIKVEQEKYFANLDTFVGKSIVTFGHFFDYIRAGLANLWETDPEKAVQPAFQQDTALTARKKYLQSIMINPFGKGAGGAATGLMDEESGGGGGGGAGGAGGAAGSKGWFQDLQIQLKSLNAQEKVNRLLDERQFILDALNAPEEQGSQHAASQANLKQRIKQIDSELVPLERAIAEAEQKGVDAADRKIEKSKEAIAIDALKLSHQDDAAALARIEFDYQDKIRKALDDAAEARTKGLELTAEENEKLADQLEAEKQIALAVEQRALAEKAQRQAVEAMKAGTEADVLSGRLGSQTGGLRNQDIDLQMQIQAAQDSGNYALAEQLQRQLRQVQTEEGAAANREGFGQSGAGVGTDALGRMAAAGLHFGQFDWVTDPRQRQIYEARTMLEAISGQAQFGYAERAQINANEATWAAQQQYSSTNAANITRQQQISYWQNIAAGRGSLNAQNPFSVTYGGTSPNAGDLSQNQLVNLSLQQLQVLYDIRTSLSPTAGQF